MTKETELPAVKVKALVWEYVERPLMTYTAFWEDGDVAYYINQAFGSDSYYFSTIRWPEETIYDGDDLSSAQAAAQTDYERRILSALVSSTPAESRCEELVKALERSMVAINDWLHVYAPDECKEADVAESRARLWENGTLSYIAEVQEQNRAAVTAYRNASDDLKEAEGVGR